MIKETLDPEEVTKLEMADDIDEDQEKKNLEFVDQLNKERSVSKKIWD